ncbi:MAG: hypothetical protein KDD40_09605, partial [Bdellovibrionales bacterium]|nr:hypothetical protein [Bdellovibrionales bacterium]
MKYIKWLSFIASISAVVLLSLVLSRLLAAKNCNDNESVLLVNIFSEGHLKKLPNCSWTQLVNKEPLTKEEQGVLSKTQEISSLHSPVILTIDLVHKQKFQFVHNYYWIGQYIFAHVDKLSDWLRHQEYEKYQGQQETLFLHDILNASSLIILENKSPF